MSDGLTIGDLAARTGLAPSAIRFYEERGIVEPVRNAGGHRRYGRPDIRRLSFAMAAQTLGFSLAEIAAEMARLPAHRAPSKADWTRVSHSLRGRIDDRIAALERHARRLHGLRMPQPRDLRALQSRRYPGCRWTGPAQGAGRFRTGLTPGGSGSTKGPCSFRDVSPASPAADPTGGTYSIAPAP